MKIIAVIAGCLLGTAAIAQTLQSGGGLGSGAPVSGCTAGQILFSSGSVLQCSGATTTAAGAITTTDPNGNTTNFLAVGTRVYMGGDGSGGIRVGMGNAVIVSYGNGSTVNSGATWDTGLSKSAAGVLAIGTGALGNTAGGLITATATLNALTTGTNADFLCLAANGTILIQSTACTISSLRFKPDWKPYQADALTKVAKMDVGTFHLNTGTNRDPNAESLQAGLSAESIAKIAPECAIYENDMKTPKSYRQECVIALLVKAVQQLQSR